MAKKKTDEEIPQVEEKKDSYIKIGIKEIITGITLLTIGISIGYWMSSNDQRFSQMQQRLDCNERIESEKKEWIKEQQKEKRLESLELLLINSYKDRKEVSSEDSSN